MVANLLTPCGLSNFDMLRISCEIYSFVSNDLRQSIGRLLILPLGLFHPQRLVWRRPYVQVKNIKAIVVSDDVMNHLGFDAASNIDFGHDHTFAALNWRGQQFPVWADDHRYRRGSCAQQFLNLGISL